MGVGVLSYCNNLKKVLCKAKEPPVISGEGYPHDYFAPSHCTLYVPKGSLENYKTAVYWKTFEIIIEE